MSRLTPLDRALVLIVVPLWVVCFALALKTQVEGSGGAQLGLSLEDAASYPVLTGEFGRLHASNPLEHAGLRAGDRMVSAGGADLRGVGFLGLLLRSAEASGPDLRLPVVYERDGERRETSLPLFPFSLAKPRLATSLAFAVSALFLLTGPGAPRKAQPPHASRRSAGVSCRRPRRVPLPSA